MPYEFLSDQHLAQYGQYAADLTPQQLVDCFHLSVEDYALAHAKLEPHNRLGMAVQLGTLRFLGTFVSDLSAVPRVAVRYVAEQLGITDTRVLRAYQKHERTRFKHAEAIRRHLNYKEFDSLEVLHLRRFLYAKLLVADERPIALVDQCTQKLVRRKVVLPGATTLARLVVQVRERVSSRLYRDLTRRLSDAQRQRLGDLLVPPEPGTELGRKTPFDRLRTPPTRVSGSALIAALERIEAICAVGVGKVPLQDVPESRLSSLSKYAEVAWAGQLAKLNRERCHATLLAYLQHLERSATDDALNIFDTLMGSLGLRSERKWRRERLRSLKDLDLSALVLRDVVRILYDSAIPDVEVRKTVFARFPEAVLLEADAHISELASPEGEEEPQAWQNATNVIGKFINKLLATLEFEATPGGRPLLAAMEWLAQANGGKKQALSAMGKIGEAPRGFVPQRWLPVVFPKGELNRPAYAVCVARQLQLALKRREVFVPRSHQHGDPRARLLQGVEWETKRGDVCRSLGLSPQAKVEIQRLTDQLEEAYKRVLDLIEIHETVQLEEVDGILTPVVAPIEALPESPSFNSLDTNITSRLPEIDLSELLLEVNAATGFCEAMPLASEGDSKRPDLAVSICAVMVAQACNQAGHCPRHIGLKAVVQLGSPALSLGRLAWVQQNYVRSDTILKANARLVEEHAKLPIVQRWGGGEVASADGLRFVVPVRSIYSGSNSKYFGAQRGITYYTLTSDQFTLLHGMVVPGTLRDSLYILATLLGQRTNLDPKEIMSDTAGYSDLVFGLFHLLGYQFSPRIKDVGGSRYWRIDRSADYGKLNKVSRHKVNTALIAQYWDDILRVVGSLKLNAVNATEVMRVLSKDGSLSGLGKAIAEIGRVAKTIYLLEYVSNQTYRRRIHTQLNRGESRGRLARVVYHGNRGEVREKYRTGMEDQLGALGLVVNAIALWNSRYMQAALGMVEAMGDETQGEDVARLSPLKFAHINMLGRYHFELDQSATGGDLRPLRDPDKMDVLDSIWEE